MLFLGLFLCFMVTFYVVNRDVCGMLVLVCSAPFVAMQSFVCGVVFDFFALMLKLFCVWVFCGL